MYTYWVSTQHYGTDIERTLRLSDIGTELQQGNTNVEVTIGCQVD